MRAKLRVILIIRRSKAQSRLAALSPRAQIRLASFYHFRQSSVYGLLSSARTARKARDDGLETRQVEVVLPLPHRGRVSPLTGSGNVFVRASGTLATRGSVSAINPVFSCSAETKLGKSPSPENKTMPQSVLVGANDEGAHARRQLVGAILQNGEV